MTTTTPEIQDPKKTEDAIRARFVHFRTTYIDKSQRQAALALGMHQPNLSRYESGKVPISFELVATLVMKYNLNVSWLITGKSTPQQGEQPKGNLILDINTLSSEMTTFRKYVKVMELRTEKLYSIVEQLENKIARLESK